MKRLAALTRKLNRLSGLLGELKVRIRDAIAADLSRIVALAVQETVENLLQPRRPATEADDMFRDGPVPSDSDEHPWFDETNDESVETLVETPAPGEPPSRWQKPLELAGAVLRGALAKGWKPWIGFGLAGLAGAAAWCGGPSVHLGAGILLAAAELITFGSPMSLR